MKLRSLAAAAAFLSIGFATAAQADDAPTSPVTGNVAVTSD